MSLNNPFDSPDGRAALNALRRASRRVAQRPQDADDIWQFANTRLYNQVKAAGENAEQIGRVLAECCKYAGSIAKFAAKDFYKSHASDEDTRRPRESKNGTQGEKVAGQRRHQDERTRRVYLGYDDPGVSGTALISKTPNQHQILQAKEELAQLFAELRRELPEPVVSRLCMLVEYGMDTGAAARSSGCSIKTIRRDVEKSIRVARRFMSVEASRKKA